MVHAVSLSVVVVLLLLCCCCVVVVLLLADNECSVFLCVNLFSSGFSYLVLLSL